MIALKPDVVRFEQHVWEDAVTVVVDQSARRLVEEYSDSGSYAAFVDVPERAVQVRVVRRVTRDDTNDPMLGSAGTLRFYLGPEAGDAGRKRVSVLCVLVSIRTEVAAIQAGLSATKTLTFLGMGDGGTDPVAVADATSGD